MKQYIWLNETIKSNKQLAGPRGSYKRPVSVDIFRSSTILDPDKNYLLIVEEFHLHKIRLPLFKPAGHDYQVGIFNRSPDEIMGVREVDFSTFVDEDGYMYDYVDVGTAINETLAGLCGGIIGEEDIPVFSFNKHSKKFEITTTENFRNGHFIMFNDDMRVDFNSFEFDDIDEEYSLVILNEDVETQDASTLEFLTPISHIVIESNDLPVSYELLPSISKNTTISDNTGVFLTNYKYLQQNNQDYNSILFRVENSSNKYHNILQTNFNRFNLSFTIYDYDNEKHPLTLLPQTVIQLKLLFESID
nr:penton [Cafeteriavirus-dependent mavirus]CAI9421404.1 penton [Cafeteriavirus-dependent mavirus]